MRHTGFRRLMVVNGTPRDLGHHIAFGMGSAPPQEKCSKIVAGTSLGLVVGNPDGEEQSGF